MAPHGPITAIVEYHGMGISVYASECERNIRHLGDDYFPLGSLANITAPHAAPIPSIIALVSYIVTLGQKAVCTVAVGQWI